MLKFVFHNKTIIEARKEFLSNINNECILNDGKIVIIHSVSELKEIQFPVTNFNSPKILSDSTIDPDSVTKYISLIGFTVIIKYPPYKNGITRYEAEDIAVPLIKYSVDSCGNNSLINKIE